LGGIEDWDEKRDEKKRRMEEKSMGRIDLKMRRV